MSDREILEVVGYAHWASFLINCDGELDDQERKELKAWLADNDVRPFQCTECSEESFFAEPDGGNLLPGDCVTYTFVRESAE